MRTIFGTFILVFSGIAFAQSEVPKVTIARWPQDRVAAVSLTFDDGLNSHLDVVGPLLKKHHLIGTFFINTGRAEWKNRKPEWQQLAAQGNEVGNHTVNHPCLLEEIVPHSQSYTPEMMEAEIRDAAAEITATTGSHRGLTFAFPCGNMSFGMPADQARNEALYMTYVSHYSFGGRGYGSGGPQDPDEMNVLTITDLGLTEGKDSTALIALAKPAVEGKNWGVFCFHGVGGDWLAVTSDALDGLARHLQQHPQIWTAPFGDVLRYSLERKAAAIDVKRNTDGSVDVRVSWPMPTDVYDLPLTLRADLPPSWTHVSITVDGKPREAKIEDKEKSRILLVDVSPGTEGAHLANNAR